MRRRSRCGTCPSICSAVLSPQLIRRNPNSGLNKPANDSSHLIRPSLTDTPTIKNLDQEQTSVGRNGRCCKSLTQLSLILTLYAWTSRLTVVTLSELSSHLSTPFATSSQSRTSQVANRPLYPYIVRSPPTSLLRPLPTSRSLTAPLQLPHPPAMTASPSSLSRLLRNKLGATASSVLRRGRF